MLICSESITIFMTQGIDLSLLLIGATFGDTFKSPVNYLTRILNNEEESWNISDYVL